MDNKLFKVIVITNNRKRITRYRLISIKPITEILVKDFKSNLKLYKNSYIMEESNDNKADYNVYI